MVIPKWNMFCYNCRSVWTRTENFYNSVQLTNFDIIGITEPWLTESTHTSKLYDERYKVVLVTLKRNFNYKVLIIGNNFLDISVSCLDFPGCKIRSKMNYWIIKKILEVYRVYICKYQWWSNSMWICAIQNLHWTRFYRHFIDTRDFL